MLMPTNVRGTLLKKKPRNAYLSERNYMVQLPENIC